MVASLDALILDEAFLLAGDDVEKLIALQSELSRRLNRDIDFPIGFISFQAHIRYPEKKGHIPFHHFSRISRNIMMPISYVLLRGLPPGCWG